MNPDEQKRLEEWVRQTARSLPLRSAPPSLERRVLAAIAARQALPWWRQSFRHWPRGMQVGFLLATAALAAATVGLMVRGWGTTPVEVSVDWLGDTLNRIRQIGANVDALSQLVLRAIPAAAWNWIYFSAAVVVVSYAILLGAGTYAYRTLRWSATP